MNVGGDRERILARLREHNIEILEEISIFEYISIAIMDKEKTKEIEALLLNKFEYELVSDTVL